MGKNRGHGAINSHCVIGLTDKYTVDAGRSITTSSVTPGLMQSSEFRVPYLVILPPAELPTAHTTHFMRKLFRPSDFHSQFIATALHHSLFTRLDLQVIDCHYSFRRVTSL
jgi:hypothetical protein